MGEGSMQVESKQINQSINRMEGIIYSLANILQQQRQHQLYRKCDFGGVTPCRCSSSGGKVFGSFIPFGDFGRQTTSVERKRLYGRWGPHSEGRIADSVFGFHGSVEEGAQSVDLRGNAANTLAYLILFCFGVFLLFVFCWALVKQCHGSSGFGMRCDTMVVDGFSLPSHVGPWDGETG